MSESELHRNLIRSLTQRLKEMHPHMNLTTDLQMRPGQPTTPIVGGYRPEVYGHCSKTHQYLIGEAKTTTSALQNKHIDNQIISFLAFLKEYRSPTFFLAVSGEHADLAKTTLRFSQNIYGADKIRLFVFGSHDVWELNKTDGASWLLH